MKGNTNAQKTDVDTSGKQDVLTAAQQAAVDSGITAAKVARLDAVPMISYSTSQPSGGSDGDLWFVYE